MLTKEEAIKAYDDLIQLRRTQVPVKTKPGEVEVHHIIPISCNGPDVEENKLALYAKEHFMAHVYLWVIHHDDEFHYQTMHALNMMIKGTLNTSRKELREFILASEEYQKAREEFAKITSETVGKKISGQKNGSYGKHWYYDPMTNESKLFKPEEVPNGWMKGNKCITPEHKKIWILAGSQAVLGKKMFHNKTTGQKSYFAEGELIPEGFVKGKGPMPDEQKKRIKATFALKPNSMKNPQHIQEKISELRPMYKMYLNESFEAMKKKFDYKFSFPNFCMACREYLPEYLNGARRKHLSYDQVWKMFQNSQNETVP